MEERRWYIAQTSSGFENSVKLNLERRITSMGMEDFIFQAFIPEVLEIDVNSKGQKVEKMKKMFPGYVFVEMIVTDESWFIVRNTPGVTGFLGSSGGGAKPVPLSNEEIEPILKKCGMVEEIELDAEIGDKAHVIEGPFSGQIGTINNIDNDNQKVEILVDMFGRSTPIELSFSQIDIRK
ncbi:transcription termination/antitermination protein NusG [Mycoplasmatota bacterium WC44]